MLLVQPRINKIIFIWLAGLLLLLSLSVWQFQRLGPKTALLAEIDAHMALPAARAWPDTPRLWQTLELSGTWAGGSIYLSGAVQNGQLGYWRYRPLRLDNNVLLWVKLGYAANKDADDSALAVEHLAVRLRPKPVQGWMQPNNENGQWYWADIDHMSKAMQLPTPAPFVLDTDLARPAIRNPHLGYALTWLSLAIGWTLMLGFRAYADKNSVRP